jgi:O-succinylbenzoic acid--CoA ligase
LPPGEQFVEVAEAVWADGGAILPLDPDAPQDVVRRLIDELRPHAIVDAAGEHQLPSGVDVDGDLAVVIATSGSTGLPKGAELSRSALEASADATAQRLGRDSSDRWLSCLPWQHIGGLQVWLRARSAGVPLEVQPRFDVDAVAATRATLVSLVPTQLTRLLDAGVDLSRFRVILLGGAAAPAALLERARAAGGQVVTTYGMSETCGGCVYDGVSLPGVEVVTAADDGRIRIRGPVLMNGYRLRPDLTEEVLVEGWLATQDIGKFENGRLVVQGRLDDVIVSGGENIAGSAVAEVLSGHPDVREVEVTGVPDEEWGERLVAVVVAGERAPTLEDLRRWVTAHVGSRAAPRALVLVPHIPRLSSGKADRLAVRALAQESSVGSEGYGSQSASPPSIS